MAALRAQGVVRWRVEVVETTGSTNADLVARARSGSTMDGLVLVALEQRAGQGRGARGWPTPAGQAVALTMAVPLIGPAASWGLLPIATGVAVARAMDQLGVGVALKWPNDVLIDDRKLAGILVEVAEGWACVGVGINLTQGQADIFPGGVSIAMAGGPPDLAPVVATVLAEAGAAFDALGSTAGRSALVDDYRRRSNTLGRRVRVYLSEDDWVEGQALDVCPDGRLVVRTASTTHTFASADIYHLR
jgi:BirA family biotin operon repressor/biotin-[acetyl-CoA-carboxylase] ligase